MGHAAAQDISNTAWAFAVLLNLHEPLIDAIATAALRNSDLTAPDLVRTAWSYAVLQVGFLPLIDSIAKSALPKLSLFEISDQPNFAWADARIGYLDVPLLDATAA